MVNIEEITSNLIQVEDGLWVSKDHSLVSYPPDGMDFTYRLEEQSYWFRHRNHCIMALINHFRPTGTFFDIGGGNGFVSQAIQQSGIKTVVIEPDPSGSRHALERGLKPVIAATLTDAGFRPGIMLAAGMFDMLEHIEDDLGLLRQIYNLLAPDGRLFLTVPAYQLLWSPYDIIAGHYRRYRLDNLCTLLQTAGYQIDFATYFFGFLPMPIFMFRSLPYRLGWTHEVQLDEPDTTQAYTVNHALLDWVLKLELNWIRNLKSLPAGGSILVVARRAH